MRRNVTIVAALLAAGTFLLYAALAARDVMFGDAVELVASAAQNGVAHPPGYPLWIVLSHLATLVPIGTLPYRVNLTACLYHALTVALVYAAAFVLVRRHAPAIFAAVLLAIASPLFVSWSLQAEVFSLNDLIAAAIVWLSLQWLEDPRRWRLAVPIALLFGLGLSNQQTLILIAPLPLWTAWCGRAELRSAPDLARTAGLAVLLLAIGFWLPYVHTLTASNRLPWALGQARTFPELLDVIDRHVFGSFQLVAAQTEQGGSIAARVVAFVTMGGWPYLGIAFGLIGLAIVRRYQQLVFAGLAIAVPLLAFCVVANLEIGEEISLGIFSRFGLLPLVALAPFAACSVFVLDRLVPHRRLRTLGAGVVLAVAFAAVATGLPRYSLAGVHGVRTLARDVYAALPHDAILLAASAAVEAAPQFFQTVDGWRPDVTAINYCCLSLQPYRDELAHRIRVPAQESAVLSMSPSVARDLFVQANPSRPFFVAGDRAIHAPGPISQPLVDGVVSEMIPAKTRIDVRRHYREEVALQMRPGYGDVPADYWKTNGFDEEVRSFYASGFFFTGLDAKRLGKKDAARYWFERARAYEADPLIDQELETL